MLKQQIIQSNIFKGFKAEINSAVGVVFDKSNKILIGLSNDDDDRNGKWCFLGGGVDEGESPLQAAIREVYEEGGVSVTPLAISMIVHPSKPTVGFFVLKCDTDMPEVVKNEEFDEMKWIEVSKIPETMLPLNLEILKMIGK
jgi:8-oxo-dGTP pyrophosphatase MutT (NUDIX family)